MRGNGNFTLNGFETVSFFTVCERQTDNYYNVFLIYPRISQNLRYIFLFNFSRRIISFVRFDIKTTSICTKTKMKLCKIRYTRMAILICNVLIFLELNVCQFLEFQGKHKFDSVYASMYCYNDSAIAFTSRIYT